MLRWPFILALFAVSARVALGQSIVLPTISSASLTSPKSIAVGDTLMISYTAIVGTSPLFYVEFNYEDSTGFTQSFLQNTPPSGPLSQVMTSGKASGLYTLKTIVITDTEGRYVEYYRNGTVTSDPSIAGITNSIDFASLDFTLAALSAPFITTQPSSQIVTVGQSVTFTAIASGSSAYQWYFNGSAISGAVSPSYTITSATVSSSGAYTVTVTNAAGSASSNAATLTVVTQPTSQTVAQGASASFSIAATGTAAITYQWSFNGTAIAGATNATYSIASSQPSNAGSYTVTVTNAGGSVTSNGGVLAVQATGAPAISSQPQSQTMAAGSTLALNVNTKGTVTINSAFSSGLRPEVAAAANYQWYLNGVAISEATAATLMISNLSSANAGSYTCLVSNSAGSTLSSAAIVTVTTTTNPGRLINLSVLTIAGRSQVLTVGFVSGGSGTTGSQTLLIRADGPALATFGVSNFLAAPTLTVFSGQAVAASNDSWGTPANNQTAVTAADAVTGAFPLTNPASLDAALVTSLPIITSGYTAQINGNTTASGTVLAEIYDDTPTANYTLTTPRLINISASNQIMANGSMTAGFVVGGTTSKTVLIRATGPALAAFGVSGTMLDPQVALHTTISGQDSVLASNAGWGGNPQITAVDAEVGAFALTNPTSQDSAVLETLAPGAYTAVASSVNGTAGIALIEIYEVP
jgi:hypothetical protein